MNKQILLIGIILIFNFSYIFSQWQWVVVPSDSVQPSSSAWETGYLQRREQLLTSNTWTARSNRGDTDNGKRYWSLLLGEMYLCKGNQTCIDNLVLDASRGGHSGIYGTYEGSFYKPFSAPGYNFYYFTYYDRITAVDNVQHTKVQSMWNNPNKGYTQRIDGKMDPIYNCNEFNSENFHWMARIGGYLLSHKFESNTSYWDTWVKNWVRGTYCAGRTEWNSHVYFVYCLQASCALYQFGQVEKDRIRGRAVADWMAMELALHYIDGHQVGPESRNKGGGYKVYDNDVMGYEHLWFTDQNNKVSTVPDDTLRKWYSGDLHTSGYIGIHKYRPPQVVIDIAQRKFNTPVEMHNVKPFYHLDVQNYKYWNGNNTLSRRFEFETSYLHKNYTLNSLAAGRPRGENCFSEECTWRFGVKGQYFQVFGNSGAFTGIAGRCEFEQIGQYRNAMMRIVKGVTNMWVAIPTSITTTFSGNTLFADMGNGVYMAVKPYNTTGKSSAAYTPGTGHNFTKYTWNFGSTSLGALVLEVGTIEEHGSYANFQTLVNAAALTSPAANQVEYTTTLGKVLKMEQTGTASYTYIAVNSTCATSTIQGGKLPRVWYDGVETNFNTWNSYEVVYGDKIVEQKWGSGLLYMKSNNQEVKIIVDTTTADVTYMMYKNVTANKEIEKTNSKNGMSAPYPNPAKENVSIDIELKEGKQAEIILCNLLGKYIKTIYSGEINKQTITFSVTDLSKGIYFIKLNSKLFNSTQKLTIQ